ncbi:MAG TPA: hypothetical protein VFW23_09945, partial [Tepidisphaeraceae bacterium]|nr:hypothetical protein [Tepidisphaeraceae bacterium]
SPIERFDPGTKTTFNTPCHIFDMHSRPGTSGSPVFVFRTPDSDLRDLENQTLPRRRLEMEGGPTVAEFGLQGRYPNYNEYWEYLDPDSRFLKLLGIHVGQFHDDVEITKVSDTASEGKLYRNLQDGDTIRFPGSMSIVVPAWQIAKLLEFPDLRKQRAARRRLLGDSAAANPTRSRVVLESLRKGLAEPAADNPSHKEDFTSLLGRAARAKPEAGQT